MSLLGTQTIDLLRHTFASSKRGHRPSQQMWRAITDLANCLQRMADGECEPRFYVSSLDPGVGKTQTVIHFLRALLASPTHDHVGVVLFFYTKQQIEEVVAQAGLGRGDFAVLVTDDEQAAQKLKDLGCADPTEARVLFTTQQRLQLVCAERDFSDVQVYQFRGLPRQVRIWDEALLPATEITVRSYDIGGLYPILGRFRPEFIGHLDELRNVLQKTADRDVIDVPDLNGAEGVTLDGLLRRVPTQRHDLKKLMTDLWSLFGTCVSVRQDGKHGPTMVSFRQSVPDDLAPLVILDASARERTAYHWWEQHRKTLFRLHEARKQYDRLRVHVWDIGGGQGTFEESKARLRRTAGIANAINGKPTERWLVICHKASRKEVEDDIRRDLHGNPERVQFLHWGIHRATNEFREFTNIVLAGTQFLPASGYEGIGRAARNLRPEEGLFTDEMQREIELGELADRILQAACRGIVREAVGDQCPPCDVYIIARPFSGVRDVLPRIFPGCTIETWEPMPPQLPKAAAGAFKYISQQVTDRPTELVSIKNVMDFIGETSRANFNKNIRNHSAFKQAIENAGIYEEMSGRWCRGFRLELEDEPISAAVFFNDVADASTPAGPD